MPHLLPQGLGHFVRRFFGNLSAVIKSVDSFQGFLYKFNKEQITKRFGTFFELQKTLMSQPLPRGLGHLLNTKKPSCPTPYHKVWDIF